MGELIPNRRDAVVRNGHRWKYSDLILSIGLLFLIATPLFANEIQVAETEHANQRAECAQRLRAFVAELDQLLPTVHSSDPLNEAIGRYFPLHGCDIEEAFEISRQSKYFDHADNSYPKGAAIFFKHRIPHGWGFQVSFGLTKPAGDSRLPAASVDKTGL
jgi:hypothetical protein